jgi:hypothetical protein
MIENSCKVKERKGLFAKKQKWKAALDLRSALSRGLETGYPQGIWEDSFYSPCQAPWCFISPGQLFLGWTWKLLVVIRSSSSKVLMVPVSRLSLSQCSHFGSPFKFPLSMATLTPVREKGQWNMDSSCFLLKGGNGEP